MTMYIAKLVHVKKEHDWFSKQLEFLNPLNAGTTCYQLPVAILDFNKKIEML